MIAHAGETFKRRGTKPRQRIKDWPTSAGHSYLYTNPAGLAFGTFHEGAVGCARWTVWFDCPAELGGSISLYRMDE